MHFVIDRIGDLRSEGGKKTRRELEALPDLLEDAAPGQGLLKLASGIQHALDDGTDHRCVSCNHILEAIARHEGDVSASLNSSHLDREDGREGGLVFCG